MLATILFGALVISATLGSLSLLFKAESIRGLGRIAYGLSTALTAVFIFSQSTGELPQYMVAVLALAGLVTMLSGLRKYIRRNVS